MAWEGPPGSIVYPEPGVAGSICPAGWDEDFDRSAMSTQVMIARQSPAEVPELIYYLATTPSDPPPDGFIVTDPNQEAATRLLITKQVAGGGDGGRWLNFLNHHSTVSYRSGADDSTDPPTPETSRTYKLTGDAIEHTNHYELPVTWTGGTAHVPTGGLVTLSLSIGTEVPKLYFDPYGVDHYGRMTFNRTDLINMRRDLFAKIADRILEVRGSNSVPRLEAVTLDARTGKTAADQFACMSLMSSAAPEKPSRFRMFLHVGARTIYDRMSFVTGVRHVISADEWSLRITTDVATWAAQL
jgi:hypothetical protein